MGVDNTGTCRYVDVDTYVQQALEIKLFMIRTIPRDVKSVNV